MPSSTPGYEYDIFISYRQRDNLYDSWVTKFIQNLRKELEATIKEDIFIYTDENQFDGIRELHHVNSSLSDKLKCLIFIPILSQTYCDPGSYAWKNEFLVFKELASQDAFGLLVKLPNGNVTSRIVPVRIHDLDPQDLSLFEEASDGPLRSVDFIFRAPGVNRPLRAHEDRPKDNQNKTYYRDQINKVANLIKDILQTMKAPGRDMSKASVRPVAKPSKFQLPHSRIVVPGILVTALLLALFYYTGGTLRMNTSPPDGRIALAVLPFKVIGPEEESRYFADGMMEQILSNLTIFPELKVMSENAVEKYRDAGKSDREIADELNVTYLLNGSAQKIGDDIRIVVQLIDARTDITVWSQTFVKNYSKLIEIQNQISEAVAKALKARLTPDIEQLIRKPATASFEGYDLFLRGKLLGRRYASSRSRDDLASGIHLIEQSLEKDDHFALGYAWLAGLKALQLQDHLASEFAKDSILQLASKAMAIDSTVVESYLVLSLVYNYLLDDVNALRFTYQAIAVNRDSTITEDLMKRLVTIYSRVGDEEKAIFVCDELLKHNPESTDFMRLKFYPLAAEQRIDQIVELSNKIVLLQSNVIFSDLMMTHVWTERKDFVQLERLYRKRGNMVTEEMDLLDPYVLIYATALKVNGKPAEAAKLAGRFAKTVSAGDGYTKAQLLLFNGKEEEACRLLESVDVGWYNLNLCYINPLFDRVRNNFRFRNFLNRNRDRITGQRERIQQLEIKGYLPTPEDVFEKKSDEAPGTAGTPGSASL